MSIRLILFFSVVVILGYPVCILGREIPHLRELEQLRPLEIKGARVSKDSEATRIAERAYVSELFRKGEGLLALEAPGAPSIVTLGFDISGFGKIDDKVWEVRFTTITSGPTRVLRAILWVHSETEKVYFVIGPWEENSKER